MKLNALRKCFSNFETFTWPSNLERQKFWPGKLSIYVNSIALRNCFSNFETFAWLSNVKRQKFWPGKFVNLCEFKYSQLALVAQLDVRPTGDQEVAGSTPAQVGNIFSWRLIMKYFLRSFSPFHWFKKGSCQFLVKECCAQYWLTA